MIDALARLELQPIDPMRQSAWLPVVDVASLIDDDNHIVVEMARIIDRDITRTAYANSPQLLHRIF